MNGAGNFMAAVDAYEREYGAKAASRMMNRAFGIFLGFWATLAAGGFAYHYWSDITQALPF